MKRASHLLLGLCLLIPAAADAATAAPAATIDCRSAKAPTVDWDTFMNTCRAQAAAERTRLGGASAQALAAVANVYDSRTTIAGVNWGSVPTWSDADIMAQFAASRDARYMTTAGDPRLRRISWQYPDNGCFARAEQVNVQVTQAGKATPYKLFAFSRNQGLVAHTSNADSGVVGWWYHVVPVVKNSVGQAIVLDAALSPCRPLFWREWLGLMANDLAFYDDVAGGNGVTLASPTAYDPFSLVTGEPSHATQSLTDQVGEFLPLEWQRQIDLGRDPNVVLLDTPPWSGYGCWTTTLVGGTATVAPGVNTTVTATCPFGTLAVGGGFTADANFAISKNAMNGRAWQITGRNNGNSSQTLFTQASCLIGAPAGASIAAIQGNVVNVTANSNGTSTATCNSGTLVSGGFTTTLGSNPATVMRLYNNNRTTSTGNAWQVSAQNTTSASKSVTSFAYCLQGTSYTASQASATLTSGGFASTGCSAPPAQLIVGGGLTFPRLTNYTVWDASFIRQSGYLVQMAPAPAGGDANAKGFAECLSHP
jgi:hypothetical protein